MSSRPTFIHTDKATITAMVQADTPEGIKRLMDLSKADGAEAFGMQFCQMQAQYRNTQTYCHLFRYAQGKPVYVTNYRHAQNQGKSDEVLAEEMLALARCGATLCDVMGDLFDCQAGEFTTDATAVSKQMHLIDSLHQAGAEVLISSHILQFTPAERVLEIAKAHQQRDADISKIVVSAQNMEQQLENLKIIHMLKENLSIPFLFLSGGESSIMRRIGGELGCCMYLGVAAHDTFSTPEQPLIKDLVALRHIFSNSEVNK